MSYSFSVRAANKAEVMTKITEELDKVVATQPIHEKDRDAAYKSANIVIDALPQAGEDKDLSVNISGWINWNGVDHVATAVNVNVSAALVDKEPAA